MTMRDSIEAARLGEARPGADNVTVFEFQFSAEDPVFAGHFPGRPILPGVFQLEITRHTAEMVLNCPLAVREIRRAKFQRPILPTEVVRVELDLTEDPTAISARTKFSVAGDPAGEVFLLLWRSE